MEQSILKSTKKVLQIGLDDESFDLDILTHINSAFSTLHDLGVGPEEGIVVEDDAPVWDDVIPEEDPPQLTRLPQLGRVKNFVFLHCRLLFDPPTMPHLLTSMQNQLNEVTWRLNVNREGTDWVDPNPIIPLPAEDADTGFGL